MSSVGEVPDAAVTATWKAIDCVFVVAMFALVVVVVIAADAISVVVADAKLSEVTDETVVTPVTVETVVSVPDATETALVLPTGAL